LGCVFCEVVFIKEEVVFYFFLGNALALSIIVIVIVIIIDIIVIVVADKLKVFGERRVA